ncbi:MAG: hypothetical protein FWE67_09015 [Planctomycetaceae bacterium]|nr:hypothetical protein [Planctomycetaceae bacterium]
MTLQGRTPNEIYFNRSAANTKPRIETRPLANAETPGASPRTSIADKIDTKIRVRLEFLEGRKHLPIIHISRI